MKRIMPDFPRIGHLPHRPNATNEDLIYNEDEVKIIFENVVYCEEKVDGANSGMVLYEGHPVIRNRSHILSKGFVKDTPAKKQFASIWNWFYDNKDKFELLAAQYPAVSVYGEWLYAVHGTRYDKLPDYFIAYDLYDYATGKFLDTSLARHILTESGFSIPPLLYKGKIESWEQLEAFCQGPSPFSSLDRREGVVLKICGGGEVKNRFKMVRPDFVGGHYWDVRKITRNTCSG